MTCKGCIKFDVCAVKKNYYANKLFKNGNIDKEQLKYINGVEKTCNHFKDKSRIIELPCKVGDTVYEIAINHKMIIESEIHEHKIKNFEDLLMLLLDLERGWIVNFYTNKAKAEEKLKRLNEK